MQISSRPRKGPLGPRSGFFGLRRGLKGSLRGLFRPRRGREEICQRASTFDLQVEPESPRGLSRGATRKGRVGRGHIARGRTACPRAVLPLVWQFSSWPRRGPFGAQKGPFGAQKGISDPRGSPKGPGGDLPVLTRWRRHAVRPPGDVTPGRVLSSEGGARRAPELVNGADPNVDMDVCLRFWSEGSKQEVPKLQEAQISQVSCPEGPKPRPSGGPKVANSALSFLTIHL